MDIRRVILYAALAFITYTLWTDWQIDYPQLQASSSVLVSADNQTPLSAPPAPGTQENSAPVTAVSTQEPGQLINIKTDVLSVDINSNQGDIVSAQLLAYPVSITDKDTPFTLLQNIPHSQYVANSHLFTVYGQDINPVLFNFQAEKNNYVLNEGQDQLTVILKGRNADGLEANKIFEFTRGSYLVEVRYELTNDGASPWKGYFNTQLLRAEPEEDKSSMFHVGSYTGASYSNPGVHRYQKVSFKNMDKGNLDVDVQGGWIAMQQHYFLSAWVPNENSKNRFYTRVNGDDYSIGAVSQPITVEPLKKQTIGARLYIGPEETGVLKAISPHLDLTVDYGWLWFLSSIIFSFMKAIYSVVGNWGWSIVLVTVLIKLAFYRLSATSYKSMAAVRKLEPKLKALRERHGDDKAKISQATMELYRQEKVNPLGGCLPVLVQIPVFIALYWMLLESVELRQAPFILWIKDLSAADPYHILPLIMGVSMLIQQKLNPAPPDPIQAKMMMFLPILFTAFFWNFPAGLVLYSIVNNTLSILQQWYITRKYGDKKTSSKLAVAK